MADEKAGGSSFWTSLPGILTGIAAVIGALSALYLNLRPKPDPVPQKPIVAYSDELRILSLTPTSGTHLKHEPTTIKVSAHYSLGTVDNAVLAVVAARFPAHSGGCKGGWLADGVARVPIKKGESDISVDVPWNATARGPQGGLESGGFVGIAARYLSDNMTELKRLGPFPAYCFPVSNENAGAGPANATDQSPPTSRRDAGGAKHGSAR